MGMIRGGLLTFVSILLFVALFATNSFLVISSSLNYENVESSLGEIAEEVLIDNFEQEINSAYSLMQVYCLTNSEYVFNQDEITLVISCDIVSQGKEAVIGDLTSSYIEQIYYKDYDCSFLDCGDETPFYLLSAKSQSYWRGWFYWGLFACAILIVLAFLVIENKNNLPFLLGALLIVSSLPFIKIEWFFSLFVGWDFLKYFVLFFSKSFNIFLVSLISGIVLIGIGIVLKLLNLGQYLSKLIPQRFKKPEIKIQEKPKK